MPKQVPVNIAEPLIFAVQKQEILYNNRHENYRNRELTELAWRKVADELRRDVPSCKATWLTLRGSFNRILAGLKSRPSGSAAQYKPKWYLYEQMLFMRPHVSHGQHTGNLESIGTPGCSQDTEIDNLDEEGLSVTTPSEVDSEGTRGVWEEMIPLKLEVATESESENDDMESQDTVASTAGRRQMGAETPGISKTSGRKRKRSEKETDPVQTALIDYITKCEVRLQQKDTEAFDKDASDSDLHYFRGLLPFMKRLSEMNKLMFLTKTTGLLFELIQSQEQQ